MLTDEKKSFNKGVTWRTREVPAGLFEVYNPDSGDIAGSFGTLKEAGQALSDLKTYGHIQPQGTPGRPDGQLNS